MGNTLLAEYGKEKIVSGGRKRLERSVGYGDRCVSHANKNKLCVLFAVNKHKIKYLSVDGGCYDV